MYDPVRVRLDAALLELELVPSPPTLLYHMSPEIVQIVHISARPKVRELGVVRVSPAARLGWLAMLS